MRVKRLSAFVLALMVHLLTLAFVVLGAWAILSDPGWFVSWLLGATSLAVGWALRPRLGRMSDLTATGVMYSNE